MNAGMLGAIAAGGAFGAVARYLVMSWIGRLFGHGFPYGTLAVNVIGSFILAALVESMALAWSPSQEMRALLVVGTMGAFTTFSTFSLDVVTLAERGEMAAAGGYVLASVAVSVGAFVGGLWVMRAVFA